METNGATIDYNKIGQVTVTNKDASSNNGYYEIFDLTNEVFNEVGTYNYYITEVKGPSDKGITYDVYARRFSVTVTDTDMDGYLEIANVENVLRTVVTENPDDVYTVSMTFDNAYAPTGSVTVEIPIQKLISDLGNPFTSQGFEFALYDPSDLANPIVESTATNANGNAQITIKFSALDFIEGKAEYEYVLAEIDTGIRGMEYDTKTYKVKITLFDTTEGTIDATVAMEDANAPSD